MFFLNSKLDTATDFLLCLFQAEEERENAKYRALQAAIPAVAIGAGALGSLAGGSKHF